MVVFLTPGFFFADAAFVVVVFGAGAFPLVVVLGFAVVVPAFAALVLAAGLAEPLAVSAALDPRASLTRPEGPKWRRG